MNRKIEKHKGKVKFPLMFYLIIEVDRMILTNYCFGLDLDYL